MRDVPRIIHQTWVSSVLPERCRRYQASVQKHHPSWKYVFWSDTDIEKYMQHSHPSLYGFWKSLTQTICRIDFVRCLWMYDFGGAYFDIDVECLKPLDSLIDSTPNNVETLLAREQIECALANNNNATWSVGNAVMVSTRGARLWPLVIDRIMSKGTVCNNPLVHTGPSMLGSVLQQYSESDRTLCRILEPRFFTTGSRVRGGDYTHVYTIHHCHGSWREKKWTKIAWTCVAVALLVLIIAIVVAVVIVAKK